MWLMIAHTKRVYRKKNIAHFANLVDDGKLVSLLCKGVTVRLVLSAKSTTTAFDTMLIDHFTLEQTHKGCASLPRSRFVEVWSTSSQNANYLSATNSSWVKVQPLFIEYFALLCQLSFQLFLSFYLRWRIKHASITGNLCWHPSKLPLTATYDEHV